MRIIEITDSFTLDNFLAAQKHSNFLQSWGWFSYNEARGKEIHRLGLVDGQGELKGVCSFLKQTIGAGKSYYYAPRGPVCKEWNSQTSRLFASYMAGLAKRDAAIFLRFEADLILSEGGYPVRATIPVQPERTTVLDLRQSEEELLSRMHQKTRYNVRLSQKKGVIVKAVEKEELPREFAAWWPIMEETKRRDAFRLHSKEHYYQMLDLLSGEKDHKNGLGLKLYLAKHKGEVLAGVILAFFGDTAVYLHGASSSRMRNLMAPHAIQWQAIRLAKQSGFGFYDFNGIDEKKWPGVTRFKLNFGGDEIKYPGTFDLIFDTGWYSVYSLIRKARRMAGKWRL